MNHIVLDAQDEAVQRFFLSLPIDSQGAILELGGKPVACVVPPPKPSNGKEEEWTEAKNERRVELIDREIDGTLTPGDFLELHALQQQMLDYRRRVAPLPIDAVRNLHEELLAKAKHPRSES